MHAFILIGINTQEFVKKQEAKFIPFVLQKIEDTRELKKLVKFSFSEKTAIVINDIDKATVEASNAFLKNLEEPTKNIIYVLTANNLDNVLPTIVSRCEVIQNKNNVERSNSDQTKMKEFISMNVNQQLEYVGKIKDRGEAIEFVDKLIYLEHQNNNFKNMENYLNTIKNLRANGNVSLQLTNFVVTMNR